MKICLDEVAEKAIRDRHPEHDPEVVAEHLLRAQSGLISHAYVTIFAGELIAMSCDKGYCPVCKSQPHYSPRFEARWETTLEGEEAERLRRFLNKGCGVGIIRKDRS